MNEHPQPVALPFVMPAGACDAHCHVFGPPAVFPYADDRPYTPEDATKEDMARHHARFGIERVVIVQPACYGDDHSALLDAIAAAPDRRRGVAVLPGAVDDEALLALHRGGVRGVRFNYVGHLGSGPAPSRVRQIAERIAPYGWHVALHVLAVDLPDHAPLFEVNVPVVIDHMARIDASLGPMQPPADHLLRLLERDNVWVKLSGLDRVSGRRPYDGGLRISRRLFQAAPERMIWGTDWPHPNVSHSPDDHELVSLVAAVATTAKERHRLLVENPQLLYGFKDDVT